MPRLIAGKAGSFGAGFENANLPGRGGSSQRFWSAADRELSDRRRVRVAWQGRLTPAWRTLAGGCHLNRPSARLIEQSGLRLADLETGYLIRDPRRATFHYRGSAVLR